ncbi:MULTISPECIES: hypothetical protein [Actinomadura]|uniref:hypothetical protein n=1 Tax=Actinomadura TaxID=1988 RepID=UPI001BE4BD9C|nr:MULTISPECIES: hypothetical protein [Actinomadura]MBT2208450.1 hypothetical protein [Actinomadura sp. NEAU-AAG7]
MGEGQFKGDRDKILEGGGRILAGSKPNVDAALKYIDQDCPLPFHAFGLAFGAVVSGPYESSRSAVSSNTKQAASIVQAASDGLLAVAKNFAGADDKSSVTKFPSSALSYQTPSGSLSGLSGLQAKAMAVGGIGAAVPLSRSLPVLPALKPRHYATLTALTSARAMAPTAILAIVIWLLTEADDEALIKSVNAWDAAHGHLEKVSIGEDTKDTFKEEKSWSGSSKDAFDAWVTKFESAAKKLQDAAAKNKETLDTLTKAVLTMQLVAFGFAIANLAMIIAYYVASFLPFVGPIFKVLTMIQGIILGVGTGATVARTLAILASVAAGGSALMISGSLDWASLKVSPQGGVFVDTKQITWDEPSELPQG